MNKAETLKHYQELARQAVAMAEAETVAEAERVLQGVPHGSGCACVECIREGYGG